MEPPSPYSLFIQNESGSAIQTEPLERACMAAANRHQLIPGEISILLCNNAEIQTLNREFRATDQPTDVLSFPPRKLPKMGKRQPQQAGDIAISVEFAQKQADLRGAPLEDELCYLTIHGVLHLCGFDDIEEGDRRAMQIAMAELGEYLGLLPDPEWTSVLHAVVSTESHS